MSKVLKTFSLTAVVLTALFAGCATEDDAPRVSGTESSVEGGSETLAQVAGGDTWYYVRARHSNKCLHQYGATTGNGDPINQWDCVDQPNVQWRILPAPGGGYYIQARHSNKCLHQYGATTGNGDPINQWDCVDAPNVRWNIIQSPHEGYYYIQAVHSRKCLHQYGATHGNGDPINQWDCVDQPNVQWRLEPVPVKSSGATPCAEGPILSVRDAEWGESGCRCEGMRGSVLASSNGSAWVWNTGTGSVWLQIEVTERGAIKWIYPDHFTGRRFNAVNGSGNEGPMALPATVQWTGKYRAICVR